ncbi:MAG: hypothetical protein GYB66_14195 [Chloroflexi bacterium]|nr:hypothetical protein [Chloroflexota bacterium]
MEAVLPGLMAPLADHTLAVLQAAHAEARRLGNSHVAIEHVLLGMLRIHQNENTLLWRVLRPRAGSSAGGLLREHGFTIRRIEDIVRRQNVGFAHHHRNTTLLLSADAGAALRLANDETHWADALEIDDELLLLGILLQAKGVTVAEALKADPVKLRKQVRQMVTDKQLAAWRTRKRSRYTRCAQIALSLAQAAARDLHHSEIGVEHLLLGLLNERSGVARRVLNNLGVRAEHFEARLVQMTPSQNHPVDIVGLSYGYKRLLDRAGDETRVRQHMLTGTGHLLLEMMTLSDETAIRALRRLNVKPEDVYVQLAAYVSLQAMVLPDVIGGDLAFLDERVDFTPNVQAAFWEALAEARRLEHRVLDTSHLLMGILLLGADRAAYVLEVARVDRRRVRGLIELMSVQTYRFSLNPMRFSEELREVVRVAASDLPQGQPLTTLHLLFALLTLPEVIGVKILAHLKLDLVTLQQIVSSELGHNDPLPRQSTEEE